MIKFKRLTIALAALLITSATAWAQTPGTAQFTVPSTWEEDETNLSATNLPSDFVAVTEDAAAYAIANPDPTADAVILIYGFDGTKVKMIIYSGDEKTPESNGAELGSIYILSSYGTKFYYTTAGNSGTPVEGFNWDGTNKTGTFTMPAANVTLNVEYAPEFTATFKALTANTIQAGKATVTVTDNTEGATPQSATLDADGKLNGIYEGQTITLTAQTGYKFRTVTATKGAAASGPVTYTELNGGEVLKVGDILSPSKSWIINNGFMFSQTNAPYTVLRANITGSVNLIVTPADDGAYYVVKNKDGNYFFRSGGSRLPVTATSDGISVTFGSDSGNFINYTFSVHEP